MANIFQPNLQSEASFERPVQQAPSIFQGLADITGNLFSSQGGSGSGKKKDDKNLALFSDQVGKIQKVREEQGEAAAAILERKLAASFASTGQEFDEDFKAVYETQTGRPWDYYSRDLETRITQDVLFNDPDFQAGMIASYAIPESQDMNETERQQFAAQYVAEQRAADVLINKNMKNGQLQWSQSTETAYATKREAAVNLTWGALNKFMSEGGIVSSEDYTEAYSSWEGFKSENPRPSGVTDEQWKAEQSARDTVDKAFANMREMVGTPEIFKRVTEAMAISAIEGGRPDIAAAIIQDFGSVVANMPDLVAGITIASKGVNFDVKVSDLFSSGSFDGPNSPITAEKLPPELTYQINNKSAQELWDAADASRVLIHGDDRAMDRPTFRKQFVDQSVVLGGILMRPPVDRSANTFENERADKDRPLSESFIRSSFANPEYLSNVEKLAAVDPAAASVVRKVMTSGINSEIVRQNAIISQIEWSTNVKWNGSAYEFDREAYRSKHPSADEATIRGAEANFNNRTLSREKAGVDAAYEEAAAMRRSVSLMESTLVKMNSGVVTDTSSIESNNNIINPASTTATLLDKYEGGGDYDTLFKFSNREGGPFAGTKVSEMTIGELKAFANGSYGSWSVKQLGYKATPMGRFQFVGSTLATTAAKMGLGDDTVFSPAVQNSMFLFLANEVIKGKSQEGKRAALKGTWEGLKKASNAELDQMIAEVEGGNVAFGPGMTSGRGFSGDATGPTSGPVGITEFTPEIAPPTPAFRSSRTGSQSVTEGGQGSPEGVALPEEIKGTPVAVSERGVPVVSEELASLIRGMTRDGRTKEEIVAEIEKYLEEN